MASPLVYLDAVIEPPRSLSPRGFDRLMLLLGSTSFAIGAGFILMGAYPIAGFLGLEIFLLWAIFRRNFAAQAARTFVRVTADAVDVARVDEKGRERRARLPAHFARVVLERGSTGPTALRLAAAGRAYEIGEHLTPDERASFARRLEQALHDARRERHLGDDE